MSAIIKLVNLTMLSITNSALKLLLLLLLLQQVRVYAQTPVPKAALFASAWQQNVTVYLNKSFFIANEEVWFSIFVVDRNQNRFSDLEKIAFLELLDGSNKPVLQTTVALVYGRSSGSFRIPDTLTTGNYLLRAYTNALKNWGPNAYYEAVLTIVNPGRPPVWNKYEQAEVLNVGFFPEGGNLVYGLPNTTAVWCYNRFGEGINATGAIVNQLNDTLARFTTCCGGRASFTWIPKPGESYRVIAGSGEKAFKVLPVIAPEKEGVVMEVKKRSQEMIDVELVAAPGFRNQTLFIIAKGVHPVKLQEGKGSFSLPYTELPQGVAPLLLFDESGKLQAMRWWYQKPEDSLNVFLQLSQSEFKRRQQVEVKVHVQSGSGQLMDADLTVSVFKVDSLQNLSLLTQQADVLEEHVYHSIKQSALDLHDLELRTMGMPWAGKKCEWMHPIHFPQYEGLQLTARISNVHTGEKAEHVPAYLTLQGRDFQFVPGRSDSSGWVRFNLKNFTGAQNALVALQPGTTAYNINLAPYFDPRPSGMPLPRFRLPEAWTDQLRQHYLATQLQKHFGSGDSTMVERQKDTAAFYGVPDKIYYLDDYTRFPTMEEVLKEYVPEVMVRKRGNSYQFRVYNDPYREFFEEAPLVLVDGIPVFDQEVVMAMDPLQIRKLEVVSRRFAIGYESYQGIMSFTTYNGKPEGIPEYAGNRKWQFSGVLPEKVHTNVSQIADPAFANRVPDQRLHLFWNPSVKTNTLNSSPISFFTSDVPGRYAMIVRGIAGKGVPVWKVVFFDVVR